jgi:hypothetical protein
MLYPEDYELLCALVVHEGRIRIPIDDGTKTQARHLVEPGYATTVPINVQSFALEITQQGYVAKVLADFGIWSPDFLCDRASTVRNGRSVGDQSKYRE